jgi:hypothetical protein
MRIPFKRCIVRVGNVFWFKRDESWERLHYSGVQLWAFARGRRLPILRLTVDVLPWVLPQEFDEPVKEKRPPLREYRERHIVGRY